MVLTDFFTKTLQWNYPHQCSPTRQQMQHAALIKLFCCRTATRLHTVTLLLSLVNVWWLRRPELTLSSLNRSLTSRAPSTCGHPVSSPSNQAIKVTGDYFKRLLIDPQWPSLSEWDVGALRFELSSLRGWPRFKSGWNYYHCLAFFPQKSEHVYRGYFKATCSTKSCYVYACTVFTLPLRLALDAVGYFKRNLCKKGALFQFIVFRREMHVCWLPQTQSLSW